MLSAGHARAILSVGDAQAMERLADKIVNEDLSVRAAEAAAGTVSPPRRARRSPTAGRRQGHLDEIAERLGDRLEHPGQDRARREQGHDRDRLRDGRRPQPHPGELGELGELGASEPASRRAVRATSVERFDPRDRAASAERRVDPAEVVPGRLERLREQRGLGEPGQHVRLEEPRRARRRRR